MPKKILVIKYNQAPDIVDYAIDVLVALSPTVTVDVLRLEEYKNGLERYFATLKGYDGIVVGDLSRAPDYVIKDTLSSLDLYANVNYYYDQENKVDIALISDSFGANNRDMGIKHGDLGREAYDTETYPAIAIEKVLRVGLDLAQERNGSLTLIDNANISEIGRLYRSVFAELVHDYDVDMRYKYVEEGVKDLVTDLPSVETLVTTSPIASILDSIIDAKGGQNSVVTHLSVSRTTMTMCKVPSISREKIAQTVYGMLLGVAMTIRRSCDLEEEATRLEKGVYEAIANTDLSPDDDYEAVFIKLDEKIAQIKQYL